MSNLAKIRRPACSTTLRLFALAMFGAAFAAGCSDPECEATVYQTFRDYRIGISTNPEHSLRYFSDSVLAYWLEGIVFAEFPENLEEIALIRSNVFFGSSINKLHSFNVTSERRNSCVLTLDYASEDGKQLIHLGLTYKRVGDQYVIDFFDYDFTDKSEIPRLVVEDFSQYQAPENFVGKPPVQE